MTGRSVACLSEGGFASWYDLCQDFGHGSSRNYAAEGIASGSGLVRSKNNSMARAGIW